KLPEVSSGPATDPHSSRGTAGPADTAVESEALHTPVAGLVLLHPFLAMFFETVGLLEKRRFKDEWRRQKAAALLYYLATGETG
ncbi:MAG TPA: contractile injection system tape measure protein, partial [Saprospiraceae bacterium]|nr:contractile injection system tape measure protein [Saprospiraceae bacterium]